VREASGVPRRSTPAVNNTRWKSSAWSIDTASLYAGHREMIIEAVEFGRFRIRQLTEAELVFEAEDGDR
jgi:hypothetical protein